MKPSDAADRPLVVPATLLIVLTAILAALPFFLGSPDPMSGLTLDRAIVSIGDRRYEEVRLPHSWPRRLPEAVSARYAVDFELERAPAEAQSLFIPVVRQRLVISLNGTVLDSSQATPWANLSRGYVKLLPIPPGLLKAGENRLLLTLIRDEGIVPGYLSRIHIGPVGELVESPWFAALLSDQSRSITFALHLWIVIGLLTVWGARPRDAIFRWLVVIGIATLAMVVAEFRPLPDAIDIARPYMVLALSSIGLMMLALALAVSAIPRPRWLIASIVGVPVALVALHASGLVPVVVTTVPSAAIAIAGHVAGGIVLVRTFTLRREWVFGFLAVPFFLTAWFGVRDVAVALGLLPGGFLLSTFVRPLTFLTLLVMLMYKLASSLNRLDDANDILRKRLAEQEAELSALHAKEKELVGQAVREQERLRLMQDLHDGLSGHLVSIIAMSERDGDKGDIERTAREALNDLRLVIQSLDLGDTDLPLALAGFRERLAPQLRRLGIELIWSMKSLPEIHGVTPSNALSVLRILQEAVTNALKHGPARVIEIRGGAGLKDMAVISVANDGSPAMPPGKGNGLSNMQRRARQLGGHVSLMRKEGGSELLLCLPLHLPDGAPYPVYGIHSHPRKS